jgi:hypothetical protein
MTTTPLRRRAPVPVPVPDRSLAADRLDGAGQIAEFWYGSNTAESRKKIFRLGPVLN